MRRSTMVASAVTVLLAAGGAAICFPTTDGESAWGQEQASRTPPANDKGGPPQQVAKPVEGDLHEFMGFVCEPTYRRLKQSLANKPATAEVWKSAASDALILAETGNLLLARSPDSTSQAWPSDATGLRTFAGFVYRAAREQDYQNAVFYYRHMVEQCNDCHRTMGADGTRLEP